MLNQTQWSIDRERSAVSFKLNHLISGSIEGSFSRYDAAIYTDDSDFNTVKIKFLIDVSSINTHNLQRDDYLKSTNFFDVQNYKQIIFASHSIKMLDSADSYELSGDLTIKGVTKNITLTVKTKEIGYDAQEKNNFEFIVAGDVNRNDWNLIWNASMDRESLRESELVNISCRVNLVKSPLLILKEDVFRHQINM